MKPSYSKKQIYKLSITTDLMTLDRLLFVLGEEQDRYSEQDRASLDQLLCRRWNQLIFNKNYSLFKRYNI